MVDLFNRNVPFAQLYDVKFQLISSTCACIHYTDFINQVLFSTVKLLKQNYWRRMKIFVTRKDWCSNHNDKLVGYYVPVYNLLCIKIVRYQNLRLILNLSDCVVVQTDLLTYCKLLWWWRKHIRDLKSKQKVKISKEN